MINEEQQELTYVVGGDSAERARPDIATFKLRGTIAARRELYVDDDVQVVLMDADGVVVFASYGKVTGVGFKKHEPARSLPFVERAHTIRLGDVS